MGKTFTEAVMSFKSMQKQIPQPVVRALNRTANHIMVAASKEVAKNYTIKQRDVKSKMRIKNKASSPGFETVIRAESRLLTPYHFKYTPTSGITSGTKRKTTVTIKKGNKTRLNHAFVAVVKGVRNVYIRKNKNRSSMVSLRSASVPQMIANEKVANVINNDKNEFFEKQFTHEFDFISKKAGFK